MKNYRELMQEENSMVIEQLVSRRRKMQESLACAKHVVAIASGKGGVGKSTLVMQLASALRVTGLRVGIIDADINGPSQALLGGVLDQTPLPGENGVICPRTKNGISILSFGNLFGDNQAIEFESVAATESHTWRATKEFTLLEELLGSVCWGDLDYLLVDLPPGPQKTFEFAQFLGPTAALVFVAIPSHIAATVVSRSIDAVKTLTNPLLGVVMNMAGYYCGGCREIKPLFPADAKIHFNLPILGEIPFDTELASMCDAGIVFCENDRASTLALKAFTANIVRLMASLSRRDSNEVSVC